MYQWSQDFWSVFLSVQGSGWALNWTSQVVRMMDQWEEWGTSTAHQNMVFLLLHRVFKGESLYGSLYFYLRVMVIFASGKPQRQRQICQKSVFNKFLNVQSRFLRIWQYALKTLKLYFMTLINTSDGTNEPLWQWHLCKCWHIWFCPLWENSPPYLWLKRVQVVKCKAWGPCPAWLI